MQVYKDWSPSTFDTKGLGLDDRQDWLVAPVARNRDSGYGTEANFDAFQKLMKETDPEGTDHELHRFGHWANGWFEIIIVRPDTKCAKEAEECENALSDYPILDDMLWSEYECEAVAECWKSMSLRERVETLSKRGLNIMAARRDEYPSDLFEVLTAQVQP